MGHNHKLLSIALVLGLLIGGIPIFLAVGTQDAEAAVDVIVKKDDSKGSVLNSNGWLRIKVTQFPDEGTKVISGYPILLEYDQCFKELNPLNGFWNTVRTHKTENLITDQNGECKYDFKLSNAVWTENAWIKGASEAWINTDYFLGNMASRSLHLEIHTQPTMSTHYAIQRANTLGLISDWYNMVPYHNETSYPGGHTIYGSKLYAGAVKMALATLPLSATQGVPSATAPTASVGAVVDYNLTGSTAPYLRSTGITGSTTSTFTDARVKEVFGSAASLDATIATSSQIRTVATTPGAADKVIIRNATIHGDTIRLVTGASTNGENLRYQVWFNGAQLYPAQGTWAAGISQSTGGSNTVNISLTDYFDPLTEYLYGDIELRLYTVATNALATWTLIAPVLAEWVVTNLAESVTSTIITTAGYTFAVDLTGHYGTWQLSGLSSTLTDADLVPVAAKILGVYPLVISNPRWDKTPVADAATNGLKFDVYNIVSTAANATIYLSLIADSDTTVWSTTVGSRSYPAWFAESQFTTVHLTDVAFPAEARKEYTLRITSGGAITEIPVVFYPAELDPDIVYEPKEDLDDIIDSFGTVNAAALKAYYDWAAGMELKVIDLQADINNYTKLFSDREALDQLASAKASAERTMELITELKKICKADAAGTTVGTLATLGKGIWSGYLAALLYREAAVSYEAGQDAFGNSTALDAWYADLNGKRIYTGWQDTGDYYSDTGSAIVWAAVAVALLAGGIVGYLLWTNLAKYMPKGRSRTMRRIGFFAPIVIALVAAVIVTIGAYFLTIEVARAIQDFIDSLDFGSWFKR